MFYGLILWQESELIALMDQHGIGTDASIPQHIKNICDRHYVDVCGPSEDGQRGQIIQVEYSLLILALV